MKSYLPSCLRQTLIAILLVSMLVPQRGSCQEIAGISVTPHNQSSVMKWRRPPATELAARVELFLRNVSSRPLRIRKSDSLLFDDKSPEQLVEASEWAWHDSPHSWLQEEVELPPDCLTVIAFNGRSAAWGSGTKHTLQIGTEGALQKFALNAPKTWLSAVTFLNSSDNTFQFQKRKAASTFNLPTWLCAGASVFALNADGVHDVDYSIVDGKVTIRDDVHVVSIYIVTKDANLRSRIAQEHEELIRNERELGFDPANNEGDLARLIEALQSSSD